MQRPLRRLVGVILLAASLLPARPAPAAPNLDDAAASFFGLTNLHTVRLTFTPEQWDALEPKRRADAGSGFGGPPGRGGGPDLSRAFEEGRAQRPGVAAMLGLDFEFVKADVEIAGEKLSDVAVRYKGNGTYMGSMNSDKRPFKLDFNRFTKGRKFRGLSTLNLHNQVSDPTYLHEVLGYATAREAGMPAPRTAYAKVYVTVPGRFEETFLGLYTLVEQVNDDFLQNWFGTRKGLLLKPGSRESLNYRGDDWAAYEKPLNVQEDGSKEDRAKMIAFLRLLKEADDATFAREAGNYVELDNTALFLAWQVAMVNADSILTIGQNYYAYLEPKSAKLHWWVWDLDQSWGAFGIQGSPGERLNLSIKKPFSGDNRLIERLLKVDEFQKLYRGHLATLVDGVFNPKQLVPRLGALAAFVRPLVAEESPAKAAAMDRAVGLAGAPAAAPPSAPGDGGFMSNMAGFTFIEFVNQRADSLRAQLAGTSEGQVFGDRGFGGGGPRGPGGPEGPGGRRRGGFGPPAGMMAQPFITDGDKDGDGKLTAAEFTGLAGTWWSRWDTNAAGQLNREQMVAALNNAATPGGGRPGGGGFGPPGGEAMRLRPPAANQPGRPGGGPVMFGPGMFLAPLYFDAGDADKNGALTPQETKAQFARWAKDWDKDADGSLTTAEIGEGFSTALPMPNFGPGGRGGPPGGPGPGSQPLDGANPPPPRP